MAKQNVRKKQATSVAARKDAVRNYEDGLAFTREPKTDLLLRTATMMVGEPKFYDGEPDGVDKYDAVFQKVIDTDPEFALKLAAYARNELYLRSAPVKMLVDFANSSRKVDGVVVHPSVNVPNARLYVEAIVRRADDITEVVASHLKREDKTATGKLPHLLKNGLAQAFQNFDLYQFSKYDGAHSTVTMRDAMFLTHPMAVARNEEQKEIFKLIATKSLPPADTWEVKLSTKGSSKESWEEIIPRMGYIATLRNLSGFLRHGVDMDLPIKRLTAKDGIRRAKVFPMNVLAAYRAVEQAEAKNPEDKTALLRALETALRMSVDNVPRLDGTTFIAIDKSGSMDHSVTERSSLRLMDVAMLFGAMSQYICDKAIVMNYADNIGLVTLSPSVGVLENFNKIKRTHPLTGSTMAYRAVKWLNEEEKEVDRIIFFTDEQSYNMRDQENRLRAVYNMLGKKREDDDTVYLQYLKYKRNINKDVYLYEVDLAGYGVGQIPQEEPRVALLAGYSDKVFEFMKIFETNGATMQKDVEAFDVKSYVEGIRNKPRREYPAST